VVRGGRGRREGSDLVEVERRDRVVIEEHVEGAACAHRGRSPQIALRGQERTPANEVDDVVPPDVLDRRQIRRVERAGARRGGGRPTDPFQRHPADGALTGSGGAHLRMHRAGISNGDPVIAAAAHADRDRCAQGGGRDGQQQHAESDNHLAMSIGRMNSLSS
jgi:hypothetical protein